jgi:SUMO ligase MMS21 Smc5/6 complex component
MDTAIIDQEYQKLQDATNGVEQTIKDLALKLKQARDAGNNDAKEWILDLKEIAVAVQSEQNQMVSFLQTLHGNLPQTQEVLNNQQNAYMQQNQQMPQQQNDYQQQQAPQKKKGFFSSLLGSSFGSAIEMGAGFGIGDDLINSIL